MSKVEKWKSGKPRLSFIFFYNLFALSKFYTTFAAE